MAKVVIYTRQFCGYCVRAKRLLEELGVAYNEIPVDSDRGAYTSMCETSGQRTVPQIWIDDTHVGGCDELMSLHSSGKLAPLLYA